mmetsp:Transcript_37003/g.72651  ORF Transcript_37003/g.72651 Transcript_37003/m.72651 type:complete len:171 (-) Transcript_37003:130-642(-)
MRSTTEVFARRTELDKQIGAMHPVVGFARQQLYSWRSVRTLCNKLLRSRRKRFKITGGALWRRQRRWWTANGVQHSVLAKNISVLSELHDICSLSITMINGRENGYKANLQCTFENLWGSQRQFNKLSKITYSLTQLCGGSCAEFECANGITRPAAVCCDNVFAVTDEQA